MSTHQASRSRLTKQRSCATCRHWLKMKDSDYGICQGIPDVDNADGGHLAYINSAESELLTHPNFNCAFHIWPLPPTPHSNTTLDLERRLGERIKADRIRRGWTQEECTQQLAKLGVNMHFTALARIEKAQRRIQLNEAAAILSALDIPLSEIVR